MHTGVHRFLAFEFLVNPPSSGTLAFSLRFAPFLPASDSSATHTGSWASPRTVLRQLSLEAVNILWEEQEGHRHAMTIGNAGSQHGGERSWWARGPRCLERIQEWEQWLQKCHTSNIDEGFDCVSFANGMICVEISGMDFQEISK